MVEQVFEQVVGGREHRVVADSSMRHHVVWTVDGRTVADHRTMDDTVRLADDDAGSLVLRYSGLGRPRRATVHPPDDEVGSLAGLGGTDLEPAPGSWAAAHEQRVLDHPRRYTLVQTLGGVAKVVVPILLTVLAVNLAVRIPLPSIPWPSIDVPDLPSIPVPSIDLPSIPWPDWSLPGWLRWVLDHAKYVVPVVIAFVLARAEVRRRRDQIDRRGSQDDSARPDEGE